MYYERPRAADTSKIEADFRNGVLEVHVPKTEAARARQIPIRAGAGKEEPRVLEAGDGGRRDKERPQANAR